MSRKSTVKFFKKLAKKNKFHGKETGPQLKRKINTTSNPNINNNKKAIKMTPAKNIKKTPNKKTPSKKTPNKKTPNKKTPNKKTPNKKTPNKTTPKRKTPNKKNFKPFGSLMNAIRRSPCTKKVKGDENVFNQAKPITPLTLIQQGFGEVPINNKNVNQISPRPGQKRKSVFERLSARPEKKFREAESLVPPSIAITDVDSNIPEVISLDLDPTPNSSRLEEGEIRDDDSVVVIESDSNPPSPDVQLVEDSNVQGIFSRWNLKGKIGKQIVDPKESSKPKPDKKESNKTIKTNRKPLSRFWTRGKQQAQESNLDDSCVEVHPVNGNPITVPTFDPNRVPDTNFAVGPSYASVAEDNVFRFQGQKPNFPRMGVSQMSSSRLRPKSPVSQPFSNMLDAGGPVEKKGLRPIVIDGPNVAYGHYLASFSGKIPSKKAFSSRGIEICVDYFKQRGHKSIVVFVPHKYQKSVDSIDTHILRKLRDLGYVHFTPSQSYDDRYTLQYAASKGGIVVSNDFFNDLLKDGSAEVRHTITRRRLPFNFIGDTLMFPEDPLGRHGPHLNQFLTFD